MATESRTFANVLADEAGRCGVKSAAGLAERIGVSQSCAWRMVNGEGFNPTVSRAVDYLKPFGRTLAVVPAEGELPEGCTRLVKVVDKAKSKRKGKEDGE